MEGFDWNSDEADRYWQELTQTQKSLLVDFLKEIKKIE
ncbi:hypothetical protein MHD_09335 [Mannheimia granulomatis]|uniref:Uncharacterized protein n=1 Tax=Mannheimia granulomatis TaxID=85402 RepID=A0A011P8D8_9PAST|nr:hypothetical protein AK33_04340 [Mannheimia granulomatis]RGE47459.1 hypothetical protein MHD_09335 [Mannheimia granulomatis]